MDRFRRFFMFQRSAWRTLFRRRTKLLWSPAEISGPAHPSMLCRCFDRPADASHDVLADHDRGCQWAAAMCEACAGTGWCVRCGGGGTRPDWDPDKTAPQRPSALRLA